MFLIVKTLPTVVIGWKELSKKLKKSGLNGNIWAWSIHIHPEHLEN